MSWSRLDLQTDDPTIERQLNEVWCGAACAAMLLRDRDIRVAQPIIAAGLRQPSTGHDLAVRLTACSLGRHTWIGGSLDLDPPLDWSLLAALGRRGSWAAQLVADGRRDGHWVVVDGHTDEHVVVRDPVGARYKIPRSEFAHLVRFMVVVFEGGE